MGTPTDALNSANAVQQACGFAAFGAAGDLVRALVGAAAPIGDRTYKARFTQCQAICARASISSPSYATDSTTFANMQTAMGSAISALSSSLGSNAAFVLEAASNSNNDLAIQFATIVPAGTPASSGAIDALVAEATAFVAYVQAVGP